MEYRETFKITGIPLKVLHQEHKGANRLALMFIYNEGRK